MPNSPHTASHMTQANWRSTGGVDNHDQGGPGTPLVAASLRLRTMEKGLGEKSQICSHRTAKPGMTQYATRSTQLELQAQPTLDECRHKHKQKSK